MQTPEEIINSVNSRETFLKFLESLVADRYAPIKQEKLSPSSPYGPAANGWENISLERFLEAMNAWATDTQSLEEEPQWRGFAQLLLEGKVYE